MLSFAFTVLVLILAAVCGYFWFRYQIAQERYIWRQKRRVMQNRLNAMSERQNIADKSIAEHRKQLAELEIRAPRQEKAVPTSTNQFAKMQEMYAADSKQVVNVNGKAVTPGI